MKDPVVWFTVNAQLDGIDPGSENPNERLKFLVYQRRMMLAVMRDKAMMLSAIDGGAAQKVMKEYLSLQIPTDPELAKLHDHRFEKTLDDIEKMGPIPLTSFQFGAAMSSEDIQSLQDSE